MSTNARAENTSEDNSSHPADIDRVNTTGDDDSIKFDWGSIQWMCSGQLFPDAEQTFGHVQIKPNMKNPLHHHPNSDEVLYLLEGELVHSLGEERYHLKPGMSIHIPKGVEHDAHNPTNSVARMLVAYPTSDRRVIMAEEGEE